MQTSRVVYVAFVLATWILNGWAILQVADIAPRSSEFMFGVFLFNMIITPLSVFMAYKTGEIAEEEYLRKRKKRA